MRIAFYFTPLGALGKPTGVGQHVVHLAECLPNAPGVSEVVLLAGRKVHEDLRDTLPGALARLRVCLMPGSEKWMRRVQYATRLIPLDQWAEGADWVYCPKEQPVAARHARVAITVHDVLAFEPPIPGLPSATSRLHRWRWRMTMSRILARADLIPVASQFTAERMRELLGIGDDPRIVVIGNGVSPVFYEASKASDAEVLRAFGVERETYVLAVGSLTYRKGGDTLLEAARQLRTRLPGMKVLVTGRRHDEELVDRLSQMKRETPGLPIELVGYVPDEELAALYRNALALVFPSRYEGFGIPVMEAMAAGAPVICSDRAALPEVAGEAACYVSPDSADELLDAIVNYSRDSGLRASRIAAGRERAVNHGWDDCAARLSTAMQRATALKIPRLRYAGQV